MIELLMLVFLIAVYCVLFDLVFVDLYVAFWLVGC